MWHKIVFLFKKVYINKKILRSIFYSIYFNIHYLPIKQAIKLPILLYKPHFLKLKGHLYIEAEKISFGMIKLGFFNVSLYKNDGIVWEQHGGTCIFKGKCSIGNSSAISIGETGFLVFGNSFNATAALKLTSYNKVEFKENVLVGWENTFMDTDFHSLTDCKLGALKKATAPIIIGRDNWFGLKSIIFKGTITADYCTIGGGSILNKKYEIEKSIITGNPARIIQTGFFRNKDNDLVNYSFKENEYN